VLKLTPFKVKVLIRELFPEIEKLETEKVKRLSQFLLFCIENLYSYKGGSILAVPRALLGILSV